ncbi:AAA family ATPase [Bradyrhizobium sp. LTSPM299]|uniref:AAA family ATPase n=1 Tax=Bradyrhizobium sp. LTSPM299 TaxID=1619233 RepID=UPI0009E53B33|nr:AAA family ATPase [Bradyrhizobium sp. LTSPM299]
MSRTTEPIAFAGSRLGENRRARAFSSSDDEASRVPPINDTVQALSQEGDGLLRRIQLPATDGHPSTSVTVLAASERPTPNGLNRLAREYELTEYLDRSWALQPLELVRENGQTTLILEDPGGELLSQLLGTPMVIERFLHLAIGITAAIGKMHQRGLVHKDIKPANVLVNSHDGEIRLTGFGIASRVPRERQPPGPPQFIAGTLAYMAPEQTGRMNRSIDSRSDLYALGVTFYQMLTGSLPFDAVDAMEWIHCHIARQPALPTSRVPDVPLTISAIIAKLLAKAAEDRYQTAVGLEQDLRRCLADWKTLHRINPFSLGEHDIRGQLLIPEKLYGREPDIDALRAAFDGVLLSGAPELVLVSGYSGIGKSAVVNELHKVLVLPRGLFASGKFDQYKRDIPYATLAQAFRGVIRQLLGQTEAELSKWRDNLAQVLGLNGLLITDLIPELRFIIGEQPPVPELPPREAKVRFQLVFRRFISAFARPEHPLALFLDDLQWLDAATLDLIEDLLTQSDVRHLLLIGAYRDNEVGSAHPLMRKLEAIRESGAKTRHIILAPLGAEDLARLVTDSFHCDSDRAEQLAGLIFEKTAGNPFFVIQFMTTLVDEALITFDHANARWCWDLSRIDAKGYADNVVDLMVGKLNRLPVETQEALQQLACLGNNAGTALLSMVRGSPEEKVHADLWEARRAELVVRLEGVYKFAHDRVQEAAYSLIPEGRRAEVHLRIGRLLLAHVPQDKREEAIFDIVSQFERSAGLIASLEERERIAELNLIAGIRAKTSAAYMSALKYLVAGAALLSEQCWESRHQLVFQLELHRAECEFLSGQLKAADHRLTMLSSRAATTVEQSAVACLRVDVYVMLYPTDRAIAVYLDYLEKQGIKWSSRPTIEEVQREYDKVCLRLGDRAIEDLVELPLMSDSAALATLDVLTKAIATTAMLTDGRNLLGLIVCRMTNLSLQYGNSDGSCLAYVWFGLIARTLFGNHNDGARFGRLGLELIDKKNLRRFEGRTYRIFAENFSLWMEHIGIGCNLLRQGLEAAKRIGDVTYAAYIADTLSRLLLASGQSLAEVQHETEIGLELATATRFEFVIDLMIPRLEFIRALRGSTSKFDLSESERFDEAVFGQHVAIDQRKLVARLFYCIRKLQVCYYAGEYSVALDASRAAEPLLSMAVAFVEGAEYHFYTALCHAASVEPGDTEERRRHVDALAIHHQQIVVWATQCPENFENQAALVGAEVARIEGRELEAERLYERAIHSAGTNGFLNNEALANELAARFHASRGFQTIANAYLREARSCYRRWGAESKVHQLDALHPHLRETEPAKAAAATIAAEIEQLDFATVVKVSQALSGEMVLERLIDTLMRLAIEHAGAERGVLLLSRGNKLRQESEAITSGNGIVVRRPYDPESALPDTVVQYVTRSREIVILDDASIHPTYSADTYIVRRRARSILCLPLVNGSKINGVIYLENNLTPCVFTPSRTSVLKLLASQAAISLENSYLYGDLAQAEKALSASERNLQLLIDTIPALAWSTRVDGSVEFINQRYCDYVGLPPEQLLDWGWTAAVHSDDLGGLKKVWAEVMASGKGGEAEARFRRSDGEYRWLLVRANPLHDDSGNIARWYGVNTDIEDRKRAELHLAREKHVLEMIASARPLRDVLEALCRFFDEAAIDCFCGIYPIDGATFQFGVAPSLPASYTDPIEGLSVDSDDSPRGQSISEKKQVIAEDIGSDPRWAEAPCRAHVLKHGLRAVWSTPISSGEGTVVGTVCVYQQKPGSPSPYHQELIAHVAHLASIAIERSQAEALLRRSEFYLTEGQRIGLTGTFAWDVATDEITFSDQLKRIWEFEPQTVVTFDLLRGRTHPEDLRITGAYLEQVRAGFDNPDYEMRLRMPDGRTKYLWVCARVVRHEDGRLECLGAIQDITRRRLAEDARDRVRSELAHVSRVVSLGALTASIAHEVNQPLASIVTNGETGLRWLVRAEPNLAKVEDLIKRVVNDARRAADIIDRTRTMASRGSTQKSSIMLAEIITESTTFLHSEFQERGVSVSLDLAPDLPAVFGDRTQLQQVIVNLVMNALQALTMSEAASKSIAIRTAQIDADTVCCIVEDSGPGIDTEHLPRLFDSFFTTKETGMGLGLPIAQSIIEAHNGVIRADNKSALGGARLIIELPASLSVSQ